MKYMTIINNEQYEVIIEKDGTLTVNGEAFNVDFLNLDQSQYSILMQNRSREVVIEGHGEEVEVLIDGRLYETRVLDERALLIAQRKGGLSQDGGEINAPMPGLIVKIPVAEGDSVSQGQTLVILESMKMQNELKAPMDGIVESIKCEEGKSVDKGATLVVVGSGDDADAE